MRGAASCGQFSNCWQPAQMKLAKLDWSLAESGFVQAGGSVAVVAAAGTVFWALQSVAVASARSTATLRPRGARRTTKFMNRLLITRSPSRVRSNARQDIVMEVTAQSNPGFVNFLSVWLSSKKPIQYGLEWYLVHKSTF